MQCPRDEATLVSGTYEGDVVVERCSLCSGIWLDRGELERIQEIREHDYSKELAGLDLVGLAYEQARQAARPGISCPRCKVPLVPEEYAYCSQILVDRCIDCGGVWLDAGEVQALERFFEQQQGTRKRFFASLFGRR